jgi:hypothetical protein
MIHCTDLIRALELYCRGYGDRGNIESLLAVARRNQQDSRVFNWQRTRLSALIARVEANLGREVAAYDALLSAQGRRPSPPPANDAGLR